MVSLTKLFQNWKLRRHLRDLQGRLNIDPQKSLLIFASPRGGSTWLEELTGQLPGTSTIWEPLDLAHVPEFRRIGFHWRQHIPDDVDWPEAKALFQALFEGRILSPYLTQATSPQELIKADRLIVKFVRGNLLLPWIVRNFDIPPPVLLLRHPCAVIASMIRKGAWRELNPSMVIPDHKYDHLLKEHLSLIGSTKTLVERLAVLWGSSLKYVLEHPQNDIAWTTITYEELVLKTKPTLTKVFSKWQLPIPPGIDDVVRKPSRTTHRDSVVHDPMVQLGSWQERLSEEEQDRILKITHRLGIDLYDQGILPTRSYTP